MPGSLQHSPIGDLPLEILLKVFDLSILTQIHPGVGSAQRGDGGAAQQRTTLRGVSRSWNNIILQDPRYWTHITFDLRKIQMDEINKLRAGYDWVRLCVHRSQDLECHLRIVDPEMPPDGEYPVPSRDCTFDVIPGLGLFIESTKGKFAKAEMVSTAHRMVYPGLGESGLWNPMSMERLEIVDGQEYKGYVVRRGRRSNLCAR